MNSTNAPLTRAGFDVGLFEDAVLFYADALAKASAPAATGSVETSIALTRNFADSNITQGVPYTVWRDSKLTAEQLTFFRAPFQGPLRVRGAAGTGKTVVLTMRFLKEIYDRLDAGTSEPIRAAFIAHGQETADNIRNYLMLIDERNLLFDPPAQLDMQITTLHGIASEFINVDSEIVQPLSLDGSEGRILQLELVTSLTRDIANSAAVAKMADQCRPVFRDALLAPAGSDLNKAFCVDLIDEFANVLEALGTREVDEIAEKYIKLASGPRGLCQTPAEKQIVLELYRSFRIELVQMGVVSLDQFISDFMRYLQSFRWDTIRSRRGFDFVFADELHLFNRQERPVIGYLLKDAHSPRVAIAYDPRQSPRNSFFPLARRDRDNIWAEARLESNAQQFELTTVFRYTSQIAAFMEQLNLHFPANDLSEEWELPKFAVSGAAKGPVPKALLFLGDVRMDTAAGGFNLDKGSVGVRMAQAVAIRAKQLANQAREGGAGSGALSRSPSLFGVSGGFRFPRGLRHHFKPRRNRFDPEASEAGRSFQRRRAAIRVRAVDGCELDAHNAAWIRP
ncbi:UvrD-helicase domain-containing protein [Bradyrhizobium ganzhouense]|uniref:UvrD-helicase domain-containing protein n=1 Tax=Bradyrhizobium ganzhouense TaxID=1179767 RepID=UPI003CF9FCE3